MDKRGILIIIILIVGLSCMYVIASSSDYIGSAITDVNKSTVTLPSGFSIKNTDRSSVELINRQTNEIINVSDLGKQDSALKNFKDEIKYLSKVSRISDLINSTSIINNLTVYTIDYNNSTAINHISYVYTYNHTYSIKMTGYNDTDRASKNLVSIVNSIKPDYKQSQD